MTRQQTNSTSAGVSDSTVVGANVASGSNDSDSMSANNNDVGTHSSSSALFSGAPPFLHQDAVNSPLHSTMSPFQ